MKTTHRLLTVIVLVGFCTHYVQAANDSIVAKKEYFNQAFENLKSMLTGVKPPDFERAVFISENAYWDNQGAFSGFQKVIDSHEYFIQKLIAANDKSDSLDFRVKVNADGRFNLDEIRYTEEEKKELYRKSLANWAIFTYLTDTTSFGSFQHNPFTYESDDPFGMKQWSNSQIINLLTSPKQRGNCFALTSIFKIFADRLETGAYICTAPQHIYIQHQDHKGHFYNVELATAGHPGDGVIQTLTYTTNEAIMSGIAIRAFDTKQSIGLCLVNLAKSYENKFNTKDDAFILKCAELVLKYDSINLNALLLKQQVLDEKMSSYARRNNINEVGILQKNHYSSKVFSILENHLALLYKLGYRQMPLDMQEILLNGFKNKDDILFYTKDKNPSPFTTVKPKDPKDAEYVSLSHGLFQEVFTHKTLEIYGHFTFNTETKSIVSIDTSSKTGFLIDPVAFAYDLGARMYDARIGRFISTDPAATEYPSWSPYTFVADNPINNIDPGGKRVRPVNEGATAAFENLLSSFGTDKQLGKIFNIRLDEGTGTYYSTDIGGISQRAFNRRLRSADVRLDKEQRRNAYKTHLALADKETIELETISAGKQAFTTDPGNEGTKIVGERTDLNTNPAILKLQADINKAGSATSEIVTNLFNPVEGNERYPADYRGARFAIFGPDESNEQNIGIKGTVILNATDQSTKQTGETISTAFEELYPE